MTKYGWNSSKICLVKKVSCSCSNWTAWFACSEGLTHPDYPLDWTYQLQDLLTPISDARFHFGRKLTNTDISVLHQACANRPHGHQAVLDIVKLCTAMGAPVNDVDCIGQNPLFYAVRFRKRNHYWNMLIDYTLFSHCQAEQLVPILLKAGILSCEKFSTIWRHNSFLHF